MNIRIKNPGELVANFKKIGGKAEEAVKDSLLEAGFRLEGYAKQFCPVDTGRLRSSIHTYRLNETTVVVQDGVDYGVFIEFGTSKMAAQPFFTPAMNLIRTEFPQLVAGKVMAITI